MAKYIISLSLEQWRGLDGVRELFQFLDNGDVLIFEVVVLVHTFDVEDFFGFSFYGSVEGGGKRSDEFVIWG